MLRTVFLIKVLGIIAVLSAVSFSAESAVRFEPPADNFFDWIQLESDEWLKGDIIALYGFVLEFDSDKLGLIRIDWDDVKQLRSARQISLHLESRDASLRSSVETGKLVIDGQRVYLTSMGNTSLYQRNRIVSITEAADSELGLWSGKVSIGANIKAGNSKLIDVITSFSVFRRSAESIFNLNYSGNLSRVEGNETINNHRLRSYADWFQSTKLFWRVYNAEYYRDTFKNIDWQLSLGTSFGNKLIRNSKTDWEITGGIGNLHSNYVSVEAGEAIDSDSPFIRMGTVFDKELTNWMDFFVDYSFQLLEEESGRYTHYFVTTLSTDVIGDLDLDVSLVWERVAKPRSDESGNVPEKDDYQLILSASYSF